MHGRVHDLWVVLGSVSLLSSGPKYHFSVLRVEIRTIGTLDLNISIQYPSNLWLGNSFLLVFLLALPTFQCGLDGRRASDLRSFLLDPLMDLESIIDGWGDRE